MRSGIDFDQAILIIEPVGAQAEKALTFPHNNKYLVQDLVPSSNVGPDTPTSNDTPTPDVTQRLLELRLDDPPQQPLIGWTFGSDKDTCDVLLDKTHRNGVSRLAFTINVSWQTQDVYMSADTRPIPFKVSSQHKHSLLEIGCQIMLEQGKIYAVRLGTAQFQLSTLSRDNSSVKTFGHNFRRFLESVDSNSHKDLTLGNQIGRKLAPATTILKGYRAEYRILDVVFGSGSCACVKKARNIVTGEICVVKFLEQNEEWVKSQFKEEIQFLKLLKHERIVKFLDHDIGYSFLVMEALEGGSLLDQFNQKRFSRHEIEIVLHDMLEALNHVHSNGLIHFDIKPDNILVEKRNSKEIIVKLADFGFMSSRNKAIWARGSLFYGAPELFDSNGPYTPSVDIWSLGLVIFFFIWELHNPYQLEDECFHPQSGFANGWRGLIHRALGALILQLGFQSVLQDPEYAETWAPGSPEHVQSGNGHLIGELPDTRLVLILHGMLRRVPSLRYDAYNALYDLRKAYGVGYFNSLKSVEEVSFDPALQESFSPPHEVIARSPFHETFMPPPRPVDLDEYFQIEANKSSSILMTRDRKYVEPDSLFDAADCSEVLEQQIRHRLMTHRYRDKDYYSVEDAVKVCDWLKLGECKRLIQIYAQGLQLSSLSIDASRRIKHNKVDRNQIEIPLAPKVLVSSLRHLGIVSLNDILSFAGTPKSDIETVTQEISRRMMTFRVLIAEDKKLETYIRVSDAISLCREYGELYYLRKEFEHIEKWAERQQQGNEYGGRRGGEERDDEWLCRFIWEQDAVVLAFKNRVVLFRKGDGEVEYRSLSKLSTNERLTREDYEGYHVQWVNLGDIRSWGIFGDDYLESFELVGRLCRREGREI